MPLNSLISFHCAAQHGIDVLLDGPRLSRGEGCAGDVLLLDAPLVPVAGGVGEGCAADVLLPDSPPVPVPG
jgi:hypothetical protein